LPVKVLLIYTFKYAIIVIYQISFNMKKQFYSLLALVTVLLFACEPPVVFDKPQPADVPVLDNFPKRLQGKYLSLNDSSTLVVTEKALIRNYDYDMEVHISQIDSNMQLIGDTLFDLRTNTGSVVTFSGDSIWQHFHETDTLFMIDKLNMLKKFKGFYFVNIHIPPDSWQVKKLELSRGILLMSSINNKEDFDQLKAITESTQDTMPHMFSPTKKQFKSFVRNEGFRDVEKFVKIKE
jgi:hypothetical protein